MRTPGALFIKKLTINIFSHLGYTITRNNHQPASCYRRVGEMDSLLEDLAARGFSPASIVDVGANRGDWSRCALQHWPQATISCFEPVPALALALQEWAASSGHINVYPYACAAVDRTVTLQHVRGLDGSETSGSTLDLATSHRSDLYVTSSIEVPAKRIDSLVAAAQLPTPQLLKIDVEGYELEVLEGAKGTLKNLEVCILEVFFERIGSGPVFAEVVSWMDDHGFTVYDFAGFSRFPRGGQLGQADVVFVRRDSCLRHRGGWDA